jgi:hypothetical protein
MALPVCPTCGVPLDAHNTAIRFTVPDAVVAAQEDRARRDFGANPALIHVPGVGAFVRVLLPVHLVGGFVTEFGTWLQIDERLSRETQERWDSPQYATMALEGYLANAIEPWGDAVLGAPAVARVTDPNLNPAVRSSSHPVLKQVLTREWDHEAILGAYGILPRGH